MATVHLPLALVFLLSCSTQAGWLSFIWPDPKTSTPPPPPISPSTASSGAEQTPAWLSKDVLMETSAEGHSPGGSGSVQPGGVAPETVAGGGSRGRAQHKPLRRWKCGEYPEPPPETGVADFGSRSIQTLCWTGSLHPIIRPSFSSTPWFIPGPEVAVDRPETSESPVDHCQVWTVEMLLTWWTLLCFKSLRVGGMF